MSRKLYFLFFLLSAFAIGANADTLSQSQQFFIRPEYDALSRASINATLRHVSDRAYFYVEDGHWDGLGSTTQNEALNHIVNLGHEFDTRIYPTETQFFGLESNPGIDNDPRVTILITPLIENAGGYYDTSNQFPRDRVPQSNARDMIYLSALALTNESKLFAFLAHEFQHLISFNQKDLLRKVDEDIWLNELRSEYAITHLGYNETFAGSHLERRVKAFVNEPSDSLTEWKNLPPDYGQIGLFGQYIAENFSPKVIADTLKTNSSGATSMNEALAANGFADKFDDVFARWVVASFLNDVSINPTFGYKRGDLKNMRLNPSRSFSGLGNGTVYAFSDTFKDWQGRWYEFTPTPERGQLDPGTEGASPRLVWGLTADQNNILKTTFSSPSLTSFNIYYLTFGSGGSVSFSKFEPNFKSDTLYTDGLDKINRVAFIPVKKDKLSGFGPNEVPVNLTISVERIASAPATSLSSSATKFDLLRGSASKSSEVEPLNLASALVASRQSLVASQFPDGSLIRAEGDPKVYVIKGNWRRHIISPQIFKFYPNLGFDKVRVVSPEVAAQYQESRLVRYPGSQRVYEIDSAGARRWLNMTGEQFIASGRSFDSVFLVNERELNFYQSGSNITK